MTCAIGILVAFVVGAVTMPPDPFTQPLFTVATLPTVLLLAYHGGYDYVDDLLNGRRAD